MTDGLSQPSVAGVRWLRCGGGRSTYMLGLGWPRIVSGCPLLGLQLLFQGRGTYSIVRKILALVTGLNGLLRR